MDRCEEDWFEVDCCEGHRCQLDWREVDWYEEDWCEESNTQHKIY